MLGLQVLAAVAPLVQDHKVLCGRLQLCGPVVDRDQALLDREQHILMVDNQRNSSKPRMCHRSDEVAANLSDDVAAKSGMSDDVAAT
jgi:hypothetical protein